jgi:hypothetical protein
MSTPTAKTDYDTEEPFRYPLGLPSGSVRAILTMIVVAVTCSDILNGRPIEPVWAETLMVALAHYFTSRRFIQLPPDVLRRLETDRVIPKEPLPLYLPRGTIRLAVFAAFAAVFAYQFQKGLLFKSDSDTFPIFITLMAYFLGATARGIMNWWYRGRALQSSRWWADTRAIVVLVALIGTSLLQIIGQQHLAPSWLENITMGLVLFYFGSR